MPTELRRTSFEGAGGDELSGLFVPAGDDVANGAGLVLVPDTRGVGETARSLATRLAGAGYDVLVPDLYSRPGDAPGDTPGDGTGRLSELPDRRVVADLEAALLVLASQERVDADRIGTLGFSAGGTQAFLFGCHSTRVSAVVDYYGPIVYPELGPAKPMQPLEMSLNLSSPLLAHFGAADEVVPAGDVEALRRTLSQFAREFDIFSYPDVGHGFLDEGGTASETAWQRTLGFLRESLPA